MSVAKLNKAAISFNNKLNVTSHNLQNKLPNLTSHNLQRVLKESVLFLFAEERRTNIRLREEQDATYRATLEADQAREWLRKEEQEPLARKAAEAEQKRKEEEEACEREPCEVAEKEAASTRLRQEKAPSLGAEHEKGPDVTQLQHYGTSGPLDLQLRPHQNLNHPEQHIQCYQVGRNFNSLSPIHGFYGRITTAQYL